MDLWPLRAQAYYLGLVCSSHTTATVSLPSDKGKEGQPKPHIKLFFFLLCCVCLFYTIRHMSQRDKSGCKVLQRAHALRTWLHIQLPGKAPGFSVHLHTCFGPTHDSARHSELSSPPYHLVLFDIIFHPGLFLCWTLSGDVPACSRHSEQKDGRKQTAGYGVARGPEHTAEAELPQMRKSEGSLSCFADAAEGGVFSLYTTR